MLGKKRRLEREQALLAATGIRIQGVELTQPYGIWRYVFNGILAFLGAYGTLACYASSFSVPFDSLRLGFFLLLGSLVISMSYSKPRLKNWIYLGFFVTYVTAIFINRFQANAGFASIVNPLFRIMNQRYSTEKLQLYREMAQDVPLAVTICAIFIGLFISLLINIAIVEYMNVFDVLVVTFPIIQLGFFYDLEPDFFPFAMVMCCWLAVVIMKFGNRFKSRGKDGLGFKIRNRRHVHSYRYKSDAKSNFQVMAAFGGVLLLLVVCFTIFFPKIQYQELGITPVLKERAHAKLQQIVEMGPSFFFGSQGNGGLGQGSLGNVSRVTGDNQRDFTIRMVPYSTTRKYLRGFVGAEYTGRQWREDFFGSDADGVSALKGQYDAGQQAGIDGGIKADGETKADSIVSGKVQITYAPGNSHLNLRPAYSLDWLEGVEHMGYDTQYPFLQSADAEALSQNDDAGARGLEAMGRARTDNRSGNVAEAVAARKDETAAYGVKNTTVVENNASRYLQVPSDVREGLEDILQEAGIQRGDTDIFSKVAAFFQERYVYSLNPGRTPNNRDYVLYFLEEQEKGFCAHFASAAVLMFRTLGIPARYCEGYVVDYMDVVDGTMVSEENTEEWAEGYSTFDRTAVMDVDITDANAHAWCEVWIDGFGWAAVDPTPASGDDEEEEDESFWDALQNNFTGGGGDAAGGGGNAVWNAGRRGIGVIFILVLAVLLLYYPVRWAVAQYRHRQSLRRENLNERLAYYYGYMKRRLAKRGIPQRSGDDYHAYGVRLVEQGILTDIQWETIEQTLKKAVYSDRSILAQEYEQAAECIEWALAQGKSGKGRKS